MKATGSSQERVLLYLVAQFNLAGSFESRLKDATRSSTARNKRQSRTLAPFLLSLHFCLCKLSPVNPRESVLPERSENNRTKTTRACLRLRLFLLGFFSTNSSATDIKNVVTPLGIGRGQKCTYFYFHNFFLKQLAEDAAAPNTFSYDAQSSTLSL